jgi:hypothetical protein
MTIVIDDWDMEALTTASWTADGATLEKRTDTPYAGVRYMRVTHTGATYGYAKQIKLVNGRTYRIRGACRSDGTRLPQIWLQGVLAFEGSTSTDWQPIDVIQTANGTTFYIGVYQQSGGYSDWDSLAVEEWSIIDASQLNPVVADQTKLVRAAAPAPVVTYAKRAWRVESGAYVSWESQDPAAPYPGGGIIVPPLGTIVHVKTS